MDTEICSPISLLRLGASVIDAAGPSSTQALFEQATRGVGCADAPVVGVGDYLP